MSNEFPHTKVDSLVFELLGLAVQLGRVEAGAALPVAPGPVLGVGGDAGPLPPGHVQLALLADVAAGAAPPVPDHCHSSIHVDSKVCYVCNNYCLKRGGHI